MLIFPAAHATHTLSEVAPMMVLYFPALQVCQHSSFPESEAYLPPEQYVQGDCPDLP